MQVVPALSKLFTSSDRTIRRSLLESIDTYGAHFSQVPLPAVTSQSSSQSGPYRRPLRPYCG